VLFVAERLTNGEYYSGKSDEQIKEMLKEKLCDYCSLPEKLQGANCYGGEPVICGENYCNCCNEALERWKEDEVE